MFDNEILSEIEKKIAVTEEPFPNAIIEKFLPLEIVKKAEEEFTNFKKTAKAGSAQFQKTKRWGETYETCHIQLKKLLIFFTQKIL